MWLSATDIHEDAGYYVFNFSTTHAVWLLCTLSEKTNRANTWRVISQDDEVFLIIVKTTR